jgi:hypothetical protein
VSTFCASAFPHSSTKSKPFKGTLFPITARFEMN